MSARALIQSERVRISVQRRQQGMESAERRGELLLAGGFAVAASALITITGVSGSVSPTLALLYVLGIALAGHIQVHTGTGFTVPTQVVFVPMLFAVPVTLVPVLVAAALALSMTPAVLRGRLAATRLLTAPVNAWFSLGPAIVLALAHDRRPDAHLGLLGAALAAQFVCDFAANTARERLRRGISIGELVKELREVYVIDLALAPLGLAVALATVKHPWAVLLIAPLFLILREFSKDRTARLAQLVELNEAYRGTALVLGDVVEADDTYTGEHSKSVVRLALEVACHLHLDADRQRKVEFSALLHDVGKIAVPKEIINKPGKLEEWEWEIIKTHTLEGQRILERVGGLMCEIGQIVRSSHERWDGGGYPDGLAGEAIPLESRIVCACDAFNAMTTNRSYRKAMSGAAAVAELSCNAGTQFDPGVVSALIEMLGYPQSQSAVQALAQSENPRDHLLGKIRAAIP
ncbi:MAG TPA: HD-GYP domain-containing protein [Solirubrobacteraceae bacterium]